MWPSPSLFPSGLIRLPQWSGKYLQSEPGGGTTALRCSEGESKSPPPFFCREASLSPSYPLQHHLQEALFLKLPGSLGPFSPKCATRGASGRNPGQPRRLQGPCMWTGRRGQAKQDMDLALSIIAHWEPGSGDPTWTYPSPRPYFLQMECNAISI